MKLFYCLSTLLLGLANCTNADWMNIGKMATQTFIDEMEWYNRTPPERQYNLATGKYPDPYLSEVMRQDYERPQKQDQWIKDAEAKSKR